MTYKLKLSSQNQITLPIELLSRIGAKSGQFVEVVKVGKYFVIRTFRDVINDLDNLTKELQTKTQKIKQKDASFNVDNLVDEATNEVYSS